MVAEISAISCPILICSDKHALDYTMSRAHFFDRNVEQYRWHNRDEATEKALETVESVSLPQENKALYSVGDTVYLDNKPFEITEVGLFDVHLRDPSLAYPVFRAESKERLEVLLRQDERNAHLFAVKPPAISEEEKLILEHEGQAALSEMGELIPDPDDAISQAEPDEPPAHSPAVSILIDGQWQEFPSASAAEKASYADFKAASHQNAQNFRITDDDLGAGGAKAKFQANLNAIQLLKHLEAEGLQASPEQQQVLSRYVGWGGLPDAFDASKPSWASEYQALKAAFTPEEYTAARASTLNAHYTSPTVIRAIYEAVGNMGFQTGNILEPSMGIGNFFGMLPENMRGSRLYGVELDSITGRIAKQLYPKANITIAGFETTDRRDFFDLAVGNVPFGQYKVNETIPGSAIQEKQGELNRLYDSFTEKYGLINSRGNKLAFSDDSSYFLLCALEVMDDDGNFQRKADMFTKRTIQPHRVVTSVDTASEALTLSIAEKAEVDMVYMSSLTGKTPEELASELRGVIFHDPTLGNAEDSMGWVTADEYLSGNVRQKLRQAEAAAAENPAYQVNVEALRAAQPKDLDASEIEVRLGATWIDKSYIKQFMFETFDTPNVAGLSTTDAQKSSDMFGKCRYMDELTGNRGVVFATGTPVSNSMTELYTMQRYLQYARLEEMHMTHFDCWASRFGETVTALELAPEGYTLVGR